MKKKLIVFSLCLLPVALYILIWVFFLIDGFIPLGSNLTKSDWLNFLSGFLSFLGTVFLGAIALYQTNEINKESIISKNRVQIFPCLKDKVTIVYSDENDYFNMNDNDKFNLLLEKDAKSGALAYIYIPISLDTNCIPDSVSIDFAEILLIDDFSKKAFKNLNTEFAQLTYTGKHMMKLSLRLGENGKHFFNEMKKSNHGISITLNMRFKSENVITPVKCVLYIKDKEAALDKTIEDGYVKTQKAYIEKQSQ